MSGVSAVVPCLRRAHLWAPLLHDCDGLLGESNGARSSLASWPAGGKSQCSTLPCRVVQYGDQAAAAAQREAAAQAVAQQAEAAAELSRREAANLRESLAEMAAVEGELKHQLGEAQVGRVFAGGWRSHVAMLLPWNEEASA